MRKFTLFLMSLFLTVGAMAQTFSEPQVGKFYKIKGTHSTNPWLTSVVENGGIDVAADESSAGIYQILEIGIKEVLTGKYIGTSGGQITLVDAATETTIEEADNGRYYIKNGGRYLYNNQPDYTREAANLTAATADAPKWGFIEVPDPFLIVADGVYTIQADENGKRGYLAASNDYNRPVLTEISWSNYTDNSCTSIVENGKFWYVKNVDGVTYLYNIGKAEFVYDNETNADIFFGEPYALNFAKHTVNSVEYIHVGSGTGTRYLSMGCGTTAPNQVKWETNNANDGGCLLTFNVVSNGTTTYATQIAAAEAKIALQKIASWKEEKLAKLGYVGGYPESAREQIEAIDTYEEMVAFDASVSVLELSTDAYYRIVCVAPKTDNRGDTSYKTLSFNGSSNLVTSPADNSNINQIFKFEDAGNGKFYLKNMNADGYLNKIGAGTYRSGIVVKENACKLDLRHYGNMQWELHNSESNDAKHSLFAENHPTESVPYACAGWESGANSASAWYIIEAKDVEITVNNYASVYLPFAVKVKEGEDTKAYAVTATSETSATLTEMSEIAANEGAILAGNGVTTLSIISSTTADWSENKLEGTTVNMNITTAAYVLGYINEAGEPTKVGFGKAALTDGAFLNNANKAYLPMPAGAEGIKSFSLRYEGTTGVENVEVENEVKAIYDLTGRRVETITAPGIYIVNGKKVLVK